MTDFRFFALCGVLTVASTLSAQEFTLHGTYVSFDLPGCTLLPDPTEINNSGVVAGSCGSEGFIRDPNGTTTVISVPGSDSTFVSSINENGSVAGSYSTGNIDHGFLRTADGAITSFDVPGALGTEPTALNNSSAITGYYFDDLSNERGFIRFPNGQFATFGVSGSISFRSQSINDGDVAVGYWVDQAEFYHAFVWTLASGFKTVAPPGSDLDSFVAVNNRGSALGTNALGSEAILLSPGAGLTTFLGPGNFLPFAFNNRNIMAGVSLSNHQPFPFLGVLQLPSGPYAFINPPTSVNTFVNGINSSNVVVGAYTDSSRRSHGFIFTPARNGEE